MKGLKNAAVVVALALLLGGCGVFGGGKGNKPKTPTVGKRIAVLTAETGVEVDPSIAEVAVTVPAQVANADWAQSGGSASKSMGHLALPSALGPVWSEKIAPASKYERYGAAPVVAEGKVFAIDTRARVHAFDAKTGAALWVAQVGDPKDVAGGRNLLTGEMTKNSGILFGGGVSYDGGRVYATSGIGDVVAFNAANGEQIWKKRPGGPLRASPGRGA